LVVIKMTDKIAITIGEKALSYWLRIMLAQKVEKIQDVEVSCELQGFQLVVRVGIPGFNAGVQAIFRLLQELRDEGGIHTLLFSVKPVGLFSSMALATFSKAFDRLKPGIVFADNTLRVSFRDLLAPNGPLQAPLLEGYSIESIDFLPSTFSIVLKLKATS